MPTMTDPTAPTAPKSKATTSFKIEKDDGGAWHVLLAGTSVAGPFGTQKEAREAGRKMRAEAPKPAAEPAAEPVASTNRVERIKRSEAEAAALKEWEKTGVGERPATPNLDAIKVDGPASSRKTKTGTAAKAPKTPVQFLRDGKPMSPASNRFSCLAYQCTAGVGGEDSPRISTAELRKLLADAGVDPTKERWSFKLPNGVTIGSRPADASETAAA